MVPPSPEVAAAREQALERIGAYSEFYGAYMKPIRLRKPRVAFMIGEALVWVLAAAASGAIGNLAYGVLSSLVVQLRPDGKTLEQVVARSLYERIRSKHHSGAPAELPPAELEVEIRLLADPTVDKHVQMSLPLRPHPSEYPAPPAPKKKNSAAKKKTALKPAAKKTASASRPAAKKAGTRKKSGE